MTPSKGYHFPEGPYVEYKAATPLSNEEKDALAGSITEKCAEILAQEPHNTVVILENGRRTVKLTDYDPGLPCLGTHVPSIQEVESVTIRKINKRSGAYRVAYA
jgi:Ser-tRNA(Ala) deacylase AlaX